MRTDFPSPPLPSLLRDGFLAFFWTDSAAGSPIRVLLQRRHEGLGQSPRGARRVAGLGLATLFAPWLVLATALCSRMLVSHGPGVPWPARPSCCCPGALPLERTLGLLTPLAAGGVVLRHWRAARRWA
jgi:hypothetical protein